MRTQFTRYEFTPVYMTVAEQVEAGRRLVALRSRIDAGETGEAVEEAKAIRERLTLMMLPTIIDQAKKRYGSTDYYTEDMIATAVYHVFEGCDHYVPDREDGSTVAATTYLNWRIKLGFSRYIRDQHHIVRPPSGLINKKAKLTTTWVISQWAEHQIDGGPSGFGDMSLDYFVWAENDMDNEADAKTIRLRVLEALDALTAREKEVIARRFGIGCEAQTLPDIGKAMGFSKQAADQIAARAVNKLRARLTRTVEREPLAC